MFPVELLEILVCPVCKGPLTYDEAARRLDCHPCGLAFPVKDGIPVMLTDQAEVVHMPGSDNQCPA